MSLRRPKSIVTDYRPPGAARARTTGAPPARPGAAAWDNGAAKAAAEAAAHDKWVAGLSLETLCAVAKDLGKRHPHNLRDPEDRWTMGRKAAVGRRLSRERANLSPTA